MGGKREHGGFDLVLCSLLDASELKRQDLLSVPGGQDPATAAGPSPLVADPPQSERSRSASPPLVTPLVQPKCEVHSKVCMPSLSDRQVLIAHATEWAKTPMPNCDVTVSLNSMALQKRSSSQSQSSGGVSDDCSDANDSLRESRGEGSCPPLRRDQGGMVVGSAHLVEEHLPMRKRGLLCHVL